ncbi:MAG: class I SAM-dependent methyltransferase [Chloroflexota bacterium]|nr:class I SAM-dependent methyltransferase [Chloroflexota bacterium]
MVVTRHPRAGREVRAFGGAGLFRGKDVLDVGTGNGRLAFDVAAYARRVLGIDPSDESVRAARARAETEGIHNVEFRVGDAAALDVGRERFDLALFSWSL